MQEFWETIDIVVMLGGTIDGKRSSSSSGTS